jgi:rfaE bifunctional protein kinase chain/domain
MTGTSNFLELLPRFPSVRILCVGDIMLDHFVYGTVERISPEAPIPVLKVTRETEMLGGAGNVARNIAALGARATLISVVGDDAPGHTISRLIAQEPNIEASLVTVPPRQTSLKVRHIAANQQMLRIDFEKEPDHEVLASMLERFEALLVQHDVVLFSDYGKGGLAHITDMIAAARKANKAVLIDPKGSDFSRYAGATCITPNRAEFQQVVGGWNSEEELSAKAHNLRKQLQLDAVLLTRSEEGMTLFDAQGVTHIAAQAREVFDVTGAGDTVIATLAALVAAGMSLREAMPWANRAGGVVVGKFGTATVSYEELFA